MEREGQVYCRAHGKYLYLEQSGDGQLSEPKEINFRVENSLGDIFFGDRSIGVIGGGRVDL